MSTQRGASDAQVRRRLLAFVCALCTARCAAAVSPDAATDTSRGDATMDIVVPTDTLSCSTVGATLQAFIQANQTCVNDTDCETVSAPCAPVQQDCCVLYLARTYSRADWNALYGTHMTCTSSMGCGCCAAIPAPPGCLNGRCGPRR